MSDVGKAASPKPRGSAGGTGVGQFSAGPPQGKSDTAGGSAVLASPVATDAGAVTSPRPCGSAGRTGALFTVTETPLAGVMRVQRSSVGDTRGFLARLFCAQELAAFGWSKPLAQINHTWTERRGTLRGLHYQRAAQAEMKLVSCLRGAVWDVAVDLRAGSPTYLHWHAEQLTAANRCAMLIPEGCAHGFQTLCDDTELLYCHSMPYAADAEAGLHALDSRLGIQWPLPVALLSERDARHPSVDALLAGAQA